MASQNFINVAQLSETRGVLKIWAPIVGMIGAAVVGVALSKKG